MLLHFISFSPLSGHCSASPCVRCFKCHPFTCAFSRRMVNVVPATVSWSKGERRLVILLSVGQQTCPNTSNAVHLRCCTKNPPMEDSCKFQATHKWKNSTRIFPDLSRKSHLTKPKLNLSPPQLILRQTSQSICSPPHQPSWRKWWQGGCSMKTDRPLSHVRYVPGHSVI